jgi:hypothetical protein
VLEVAESELSVLLKLKDDATKELGGLKGKWGGLFKGMGIGVAALGASAIAAGAASVKSFADAGDEVQKMALRTGFGTEALSELRHAANLSGTSLAGFETGVKRMARFVDDANEGLSTSTRTMEQLGLTAEDIEGLSPEETFNKFAQSIASLEDPLARANAAQEVFGRAGTTMLPMFAEGAEGMAKMRQEAHDLGVVFDEDAANSAAEFKDNLTRLQGAFQGLMNQVAQALLPVLDPLIQAFTELVKALPIGEITTLIKSLLPPLVAILVDLFSVIPFATMVKLVTTVLHPAMILLKAIMSILGPLLTLLEPVLMIVTLIFELITPVIEGLAWVIGNVGKGLGFLAGGAKSALAGVGLGGGGGSALLPPAAGTTVNVNVAGSVRSDQELAQILKTELLKDGLRNVSTGLT